MLSSSPSPCSPSATAPETPGSGLDYAPGGYAWGCLIRGFHFLYVYGALGDYRDSVRGDEGRSGDVMHKGRGHSLDDVRRQAEDAARNVSRVYEDLGSVRVVSARLHLAQSPKPLDAPGGSRRAG